MAKSEYYFPLLYRRLLVSTTGWKDEEFGAYMRLLINQFDNDNRISPDLDDLKRLAPSIKKNWPLISKKFKTDENGMLYNEVMSEIFENMQSQQERSRENGKHGGRPKTKEPEKTQQVNSGFDSGNPDERHTITITKDKDINTVNTEKRSAPLKEEVDRVFMQQGGTKEMADKFFNDYEAIGWKKKGQPVINFAPLVGAYISNWHENNNKNSDANKSNSNCNGSHTSARDKQTAANENLLRKLRAATRPG